MPILGSGGGGAGADGVGCSHALAIFEVLS